MKRDKRDMSRFMSHIQILGGDRINVTIFVTFLRDKNRDMDPIPPSMMDPEPQRDTPHYGQGSTTMGRMWLFVSHKSANWDGSLPYDHTKTNAAGIQEKTKTRTKINHCGRSVRMLEIEDETKRMKEDETHRLPKGFAAFADYILAVLCCFMCWMQDFAASGVRCMVAGLCCAISRTHPGPFTSSPLLLSCPAGPASSSLWPCLRRSRSSFTSTTWRAFSARAPSSLLSRLSLSASRPWPWLSVSASRSWCSASWLCSSASA